MFANSVKNFVFPKKYVSLIAFIIALVVVFQYALWYAFPSQERIFTGAYNDNEGGILAGVRAVPNGFINYWTLDNEPLPRTFIFDINNHGPVYILVLIGLLAMVLGNQVILAYVIAKFLFTFFLIIVSYHLFSLITNSKKEHETAFFLYIISIGFGGLIHLFNVAFLNAELMPASFFAFGVGALRVAGFYIAFTIALSFMSIIAVIKNKIVLSAVLAGLALIFYPSHGIVTFVIISIYLLINLRKWEILKVALIMIVFSVPWVINYLSNPYIISTYLMLNVKNSVVFLPSIVLGFGAAFLFLVFHFRKVLSTKRGVIFAILLLVAAAMTSLSFFKDVSTIDISAGSKVLNLSGFASSNFILLSAPLILLLILSVVYVVKERRRYDKKYLFVLLWFLIMMIIIFSPREITRLFPDKIVQIIYAPVMVIAAKGLLEFSARYHISTKTLFLAVLVISVPGIIIWLGSVQLQPRIYSNLSGIAFYTHDEYESVKFLENQELGTVLAPKEIAINIPQMSGKKALLIIPEWSGITYNFNNKTADYATFYSGTDDQRLAIVHKYNITYVFAETDDFENSTIMKSIYEAGKVKLYKIN